MKALATGIAGSVFALAAFLMYALGNDLLFGGTALCALCAFIATIWFYTPDRLSQAEYQSLPGSTTDRGHQCVFCGWRGIHRRTPYQTNTTLADCSKCRAELWYE